MEKVQKPGNPKYKNVWSHSVRQKTAMWHEYVMEWSVGKVSNTKCYRHALASLGNTNVPAMEENRVLWAHKILLGLERDLIVLLRIRYTKSVRLGMATRCPGQSIYGYPQVFTAIP